MTDATDTPPPAVPLAPGHVPFPPGEPGVEPPAYGWGAAPSPLPLDRAGRSRQAIAAFALGLLGVVPLGLLFGVLALVRIGRTRKKGKVLAVLGLVFSGLWSLVAVIAILAASLYFASPGNGSALPLLGGGHPGQQEVSTLPVGACFDVPAGTQPTDWVTVTPCTGLHDRQLFARIPVQGTYPGATVARRQALTACVQAEFTHFIDPWGIGRQGAELLSYFPRPSSWVSGQPQDWCTVRARVGAAPLTASLEQSPSRFTAQQRAVLDTLRETGMLRFELGAFAPTDWSAGTQVAATLADADRAEARALHGLSGLNTDFLRQAGATLAQQDLADATTVSALARATSPAAWTAGMDALTAHGSLNAAFNTVWMNLGIPLDS